MVNEGKIKSDLSTSCYEKTFTLYSLTVSRRRNTEPIRWVLSLCTIAFCKNDMFLFSAFFLYLPVRFFITNTFDIEYTYQEREVPSHRVTIGHLMILNHLLLVKRVYYNIHAKHAFFMMMNLLGNLFISSVISRRVWYSISAEYNLYALLALEISHMILFAYILHGFIISVCNHHAGALHNIDIEVLRKRKTEIQAYLGVTKADQLIEFFRNRCYLLRQEYVEQGQEHVE